MNLVVLVSNVPEHSEEILSALIVLDVRGLVALSGETVMEVLSRDIPLFAGLRQLLTSPSRATSKTILGVSSDERILPKLQNRLKHVGIDFESPGVGYALTLSLKDWMGNLDDE